MTHRRPSDPRRSCMRGRTHRYGAERSQRAELHMPTGQGPHPVMVLIHGGSWQVRYGKIVMRGLAGDLMRRGWAVWNIEYRRVGDGGGWPATFLDVAAALDQVPQLDAPLDLDRVAARALRRRPSRVVGGGSRAACSRGRSRPASRRADSRAGLAPGDRAGRRVRPRRLSPVDCGAAARGALLMGGGPDARAQSATRQAIRLPCCRGRCAGAAGARSARRGRLDRAQPQLRRGGARERSGGRGRARRRSRSRARRPPRPPRLAAHRLGRCARSGWPGSRASSARWHAAR